MKSFRLSGTELEDLFNDVFVSLIKDDCKKLRQYRGDHGCSVASWIRTITASQVLDYIRKAGKSISYVDIETEEVEYELVCESSDPAAALEERERQETVSQAMAQLSENDKFFIELYYRKELPPEEVAEVLGLSVNTVYSRISRIKSRLQEIIDQNARKPVK